VVLESSVKPSLGLKGYPSFGLTEYRKNQTSESDYG